MAVLSEFDLMKGVEGIDTQLFANYLATGNMFLRGEKVTLTNERNRRLISQIQDKDDSWTPVEFEKRCSPG
jgi:hypothetical protein